MTKQELFKEMLCGDQKDGFFPPPAVADLDLEYVEYKEGEYIKLKAPIKTRYYNPGQVMFGGYYGMFFDAAFGPFSFIETQLYSTSLDMNMTYLKPVSVKDESIVVQANLISQSKSFLIMDGRMWKKDGTLVATCTTRMMILDPTRR